MSAYGGSAYGGGPGMDYTRIIPKQEESSNLPYFDKNSGVLRIPPGAAQRGFEFTALPAIPPPSGNGAIDHGAIRDVVTKMFTEQMKQQTQKSEDEPDGNSLWTSIAHRVRDEIRAQGRDEDKKFDNMWFELKPNTFSTAIWALLVMDIDALSLTALTETKSQSKLVPVEQRWVPVDAWYWPLHWLYKYWRLRLWPFLSSALFLFVGVILFGGTVGIQIGFTYLLYTSLDFTHFNQDGVELICATTGWLQLISIGFFMAYMLGEVPRLIKVFVLIWASEFETSEDRGPHLSKRLWIDNDKLATAESEQAMGMGIAHHADSSVIGQNADNCHVRSKAWITWRRILSSFVNLCDLTVTGFVLYVGVMYIFWSGYTSMDPSHLPDKWAPLNEETGFPEDGFPWMSNTSGVEEVIMATLALVFIMDIDELLFSFLLPRSVQKVVEECRLSCVYWMPSVFEADDFKKLGMPLDEEWELLKDFKTQQPNETFCDMVKRFETDHDKKQQEANGGDGAGQSAMQEKMGVSAQSVNAPSAKVMKDKFISQHRALMKKQLKVFQDLRDKSQKFTQKYEEEVKNRPGFVLKKNVEEKKFQDFGLLFTEAQKKQKEHELNQNYTGIWMRMVPFLTVAWIFIMIALGFAVVLMIRHYQGCAEFDSIEMPDMPQGRSESSFSDWGAYLVAVVPGGIIVLLFLYSLFEFWSVLGREFPTPESFKDPNRQKEIAEAGGWPTVNPSDFEPQRALPAPSNSTNPPTANPPAAAALAMAFQPSGHNGQGYGNVNGQGYNQGGMQQVPLQPQTRGAPGTPTPPGQQAQSAPLQNLPPQPSPQSPTYPSGAYHSAAPPHPHFAAAPARGSMGPMDAAMPLNGGGGEPPEWRALRLGQQP